MQQQQQQASSSSSSSPVPRRTHVWHAPAAGTDTHHAGCDGPRAPGRGPFSKHLLDSAAGISGGWIRCEVCSGHASPVCGAERAEIHTETPLCRDSRFGSHRISAAERGSANKPSTVSLKSGNGRSPAGISAPADSEAGPGQQHTDTRPPSRPESPAVHPGCGGAVPPQRINPSRVAHESESCCA